MGRSLYNILRIHAFKGFIFSGKADVSDATTHGGSGLLAHDGYFSLRYQSAGTRVRALSSASFATQSSLRSAPTPGPTASLSSSVSSRASWSSILNASASGVRFLMSGQEGSSTPKAHSSPTERNKSLLMSSDIPLRTEGPGAVPRTPDNPEKVQFSPLNSTQRHQGTLKSWSEPVVPPSHTSSRIAISFASAGHQDPNEMVGIGLRPSRKHLLANIKTDLTEEDRDDGCIFQQFLCIDTDFNVDT